MNGPYKIGTLSKLTGFSPLLLRAWERRFSLFAPSRGSGGQRLYGDDDLAVLMRVRTLIDEGRAIGEIARAGRDGLLAQADARLHAPADAAPLNAGAAADGSSRVDRWRQRLVAAAMAMDGSTIGATLDEAFASLSADRVVVDVIEPVAIEIGVLWRAGQCSVASEHLISGHFLQRVGRLLESAQPPAAGAPRLIAACFPDERHELGLMIVAWHMARRGVRVVYLGASLPAAELAKACQTLQPRATLLSVTQARLFTRHRAEIVRRFSSGALGRVYLGGQGVPARAVGRGRVTCLPSEPMPAMLQRVIADLGVASRRSVVSDNGS